MKTTTQIYEQRDRIFRMSMERGRRRAAAADPATGGSEHLVSNWGNDASRAAWAATWAAWRKVDELADRMYDEAEHRRHGPIFKFRPLWCQFCRVPKQAPREEGLPLTA